MTTGTVKWFNTRNGYGFIQLDDSSADVFVHISAILRAGMDNPHKGERFRFELEHDGRGKSYAVNLRRP